jgi:hypothetical protein
MGEHWVGISFEGGLDVANDEEVVIVAAGHLGGERVEAGGGRVCPSAKIVQYGGDVGQWQLRATEQTDELAGANLGSAIAKVTVGGVDKGRAEQANLIVDPKGLRAQPGTCRELAAGQQWLWGIVTHQTILVPAPGAGSSPRAAAVARHPDPTGLSSTLHAEGAVCRPSRAVDCRRRPLTVQGSLSDTRAQRHPVPTTSE